MNLLSLMVRQKVKHNYLEKWNLMAILTDWQMMMVIQKMKVILMEKLNYLVIQRKMVRHNKIINKA